MKRLMEIHLLIFLLSSGILLRLSLSQSIAQPNYAANYCSGGNYTANSIYRSNLSNVFFHLHNYITNSARFYTTTSGQNPDIVYGLFMCRGDITSQECIQCLDTAMTNITQSCPNEETAIIWYDLCMLRYSNQSFFSTLQYDPTYHLWNLNNATNSSQFRQTVIDLVGNLMEQATFSTGKFANGTLKYSNSSNEIHGLVQCTLDISQGDYLNCLGQAKTLINSSGINGYEGGRILMPSCNIRFEIYPFYESPPPANPSVVIIITVVVAITAVILFCGILCICFWRRRRPKGETDDLDDISMVQSLQFDFGTIRAATSNFSNLNKLGQGVFGPVHKGKLLNGQDVAVKRLYKDSGQGELEFKNEVVLVAKLQHKNLVRLLGFSLQREEKLLIYEFLPNTSLDHFIFDPIKRAHLDWKTCQKIIKGISKGLLYLHEESRLKIIHRDLKASNVLLDEKMNPKFSDFSMARLSVVDHTQNTSRIVGTYRKNNNFKYTEDLLCYAWRNWREETTLELVDTTLRGNCSISEVMRCIHIGLLCVQENATERPTMASVDLMFNSSSITLSIPSPPAFSFYNIKEADKSSSENDSRVTEQVPSTTKSAQRSTCGTSSIELCPQ